MLILPRVLGGLREIMRPSLRWASRKLLSVCFSGLKWVVGFEREKRRRPTLARKKRKKAKRKRKGG